MVTLTLKNADGKTLSITFERDETILELLKAAYNLGYCDIWKMEGTL